jgi:hypothetical protein
MNFFTSCPPEDGNGTQFRNRVVSIYIYKATAMDEVQDARIKHKHSPKIKYQYSTENYK